MKALSQYITERFVANNKNIVIENQVDDVMRHFEIDYLVSDGFMTRKQSAELRNKIREIFSKHNCIGDPVYYTNTAVKFNDKQNDEDYIKNTDDMITNGAGYMSTKTTKTKTLLACDRSTSLYFKANEEEKNNIYRSLGSKFYSRH